MTSSILSQSFHHPRTKCGDSNTIKGYILVGLLILTLTTMSEGQAATQRLEKLYTNLVEVNAQAAKNKVNIIGQHPSKGYIAQWRAANKQLQAEARRLGLKKVLTRNYEVALCEYAVGLPNFYLERYPVRYKCVLVMNELVVLKYTKPEGFNTPEVQTVDYLDDFVDQALRDNAYWWVVHTQDRFF
ncbi:MAG: hypothetical protein HRU05_00915 [Oceanospirillaceae bacterium]|nr:hypothetical protein [Oceanospirillaceae bacterium]